MALQTLHGLVNKPSPANLARAIESMGWLGGAIKEGAVAAAFLSLFTGAALPSERSDRGHRMAPAASRRPRLGGPAREICEALSRVARLASRQPGRDR